MDVDDDTGVERRLWSKDCTETVARIALYQYPRSCGFPIVNVTSNIHCHRGSSVIKTVISFTTQL